MSRRSNVVRICEICGSQFGWRKSSTGRFCSKRCSSSAPDVVARIVRASRESAAMRGDKQRGRGEGRTYRKLNGRHEHRVVAEEKIGRPLRPGEIVHHIDGDKHNNSPENLAVMTQSEHIRLHNPWHWRSAA